MAQRAVDESTDGRRLRPAIQLYTLRSIETSLPDTIRRVSQAGFEGVEFAGELFESDPRAVRRALDETDTVPVAAHVDLSELEARPEPVADRCRRVGCDHVVIPHLGADLFRTTERVDALGRRLEAVGDRLDSYGIDLSYHTSREPFLPRLDRFGLGEVANLPSPGLVWRLLAEGIDRVARGDGRTVDGTGFGRLVSQTDDLTFEVDAGWVTAGGYDPAALLDSLGDRLSFVHVTDLARSRRFPPDFRSVPPGTGLVDHESVFDACDRADVEWLVFEDDDPADPERAIEQGISLLDGRSESE